MGRISGPARARAAETEGTAHETSEAKLTAQLETRIVTATLMKKRSTFSFRPAIQYTMATKIAGVMTYMGIFFFY